MTIHTYIPGTYLIVQSIYFLHEGRLGRVDASAEKLSRRAQGALASNNANVSHFSRWARAKHTAGSHVPGKKYHGCGRVKQNCRSKILQHQRASTVKPGHNHLLQSPSRTCLSDDCARDHTPTWCLERLAQLSQTVARYGSHAHEGEKSAPLVLLVRSALHDRGAVLQDNTAHDRLGCQHP